MLTPLRSPLANCYCEILVGTLRGECLDFVIPDEFGAREVTDSNPGSPTNPSYTYSQENSPKPHIAS